MAVHSRNMWQEYRSKKVYACSWNMCFICLVYRVASVLNGMYEPVSDSP